MIESGVDRHDVDPPMTDKKEEDSPLKDVEEFSNLIIVDSSYADAKESSNFLGVEDRTIGLGSLSFFRMSLLIGSLTKLENSVWSIE